MMEEKIICNKQTLVDIANAIREVTGYTEQYYPYELAALIKSLKPSKPEDPESFSGISLIVEQGKADLYFSVGDQVITNYTNDGTVYENPFDIVQIECNPTLESGEIIHGMMLQQHYATIQQCPLDAQEALYESESDLPVGTYYFTVSNDEGMESENGKTIYFSLTKTLPAGGQIVFDDSNGFKSAIAGQTISTYSSAESLDAIETVTLYEGIQGTNLGSTDGTGNLNYLPRAFYGNTNYKYSMLRQFLNSDKPKDQWWKKQHKWDRLGWFSKTNDGFLYGMDPDFLSIVKPIKIQVACDNIISNGRIDILYDKFFPISLEQINAVPQVSGVEGTALDYWVNMAQSNTTENLTEDGKFQYWIEYSILRILKLSDKTSATSSRLISARINSSRYSWVVTSSGTIDITTPIAGLRCNPACVI